MARDYPSVEEIRKAAEEVAETAAKVRGRLELRFATEGDAEAGQKPKEFLGRAEDKYATGSDGKYLGTHDDWAQLRGVYSWIPDLFVSYVGPEPAGFDGPVETMERAWKALYDRESGVDPVGTHIRMVESHLSGWSGFTAETFRTKYLHRIPDAVKSQAQLAFVLQHAALADQDVWIEARRNLVDLAAKTKVSLESLGSCGGADSVVMILTVVGIVASVVVLWPAAAVACTLVASTASAGALIAGTSASEAVEAEVAGDSVDAILQSMVNATDEIRKQIHEAERKIIDGLQHNLGLVSDATHEHGVPSTRDGFLPPRPTLVSDSLVPSAIRADFRPD
jgi:hypothetical protein